MSMNVSKLNKLSELVSLDSLRRPVIVLNPKGEYTFRPKRRK